MAYKDSAPSSIDSESEDTNDSSQNEKAFLYPYSDHPYSPRTKDESFQSDFRDEAGDEQHKDTSYFTWLFEACTRCIRIR